MGKVHRIAIVILNYMEWGDTVECIKSIRFSSDVLWPIVVVDNASPNDSLQKLLSLYRHDDTITVISSKSNVGYSAGNNIGLKFCLDLGYDYALIANSDVLFSKGAIESLLSFIEDHARCAVVGPNILNFDGSFNKVSRIAERNIMEIFFQNFRINCFGFRSKILSHYHYLDVPYTISHKVHMVSGACFCISLKFISEFGYLDEGTFLYFEEPILGLKIAQAGWYAYHLGDISVTHAHGGSTKNVAAFAFSKYVRSFIYYSRKFLRANQITVLSIVFLFFLNFYAKSLYRPDFKGRNIFFLKEVYQELTNSFNQT